MRAKLAQPFTAGMMRAKIAQSFYGWDDSLIEGKAINGLIPSRVLL